MIVDNLSSCQWSVFVGCGGFSLTCCPCCVIVVRSVEFIRELLSVQDTVAIFRGVTGKDGSLHSSTIGNGLIRVDALVELLAIEEVGNEFDDTWDTSGTTNQDDFMDVRLIDLRVALDLLNRIKSTAEKILAELFETRTSERSVEINTLKERVDFDGYLSSRGKGTLSTLASSTETMNSAGSRS